MRLINSGGVEAILPHSLDDGHLMLIAYQFRDLMAGVGGDAKGQLRTCSLAARFVVSPERVRSALTTS